MITFEVGVSGITWEVIGIERYLFVKIINRVCMPCLYNQLLSAIQDITYQLTYLRRLCRAWQQYSSKIGRWWWGRLQNKTTHRTWRQCMTEVGHWNIILVIDNFNGCLVTFGSCGGWCGSVIGFLVFMRCSLRLDMGLLPFPTLRDCFCR